MGLSMMFFYGGVGGSMAWVLQVGFSHGSLVSLGLRIGCYGFGSSGGYS